MADPHNNQELFFISASVCWCTALLQLLGIIRFNRLRGLLIIQKRYPRLVITEAVVYCFVLLFLYPAWMSMVFQYPAIQGHWWRITLAVCFQYTYQIAPTIETCRIWLIFYDLHYLHSSKNQRWKTVIDVSHAERDWYLQNRGTWGNQKYMVRFGFAYYILASTMVFATANFMTYLQIGMDGLMVYMTAVQYAFNIPHVVLPLCLYVRLPQKLQERFLFTYEFMWSAVILMTGMITFAIAIALIIFDVVPLGWILSLIIVCYQTSPSLLSTFWIAHKVSAMTEWKEVYCVRSPGTFMEKLRETLDDEQKCEAFIDGMYREFSSEVILSFLEFVQFKKYIKEQIGKICVAGDEDPYNFQLYDGMPRSTIVYDPSRLEQRMTPLSLDGVSSLSGDSESGARSSDNSLMRCRKIAHLFFEKYIDYHSEHEINISGPLRNKYVKLEQGQYEAMELEQFVTIYDDLIAEMMKYMAASCRRFENPDLV